MELKGILCPHCGSGMSKVKDSRDHLHGKMRRRECFDCDKMFGTFEHTVPVCGVVVECIDGRYRTYSTDDWVERVADKLEKIVRLQINSLPWKKAVRRAAGAKL